MRNGHAVLIDDVISVQNQVEIERPDVVPVSSNSAPLFFKIQKQLQQISSGQRRLTDNDGVEVARLILIDADGICFDD